MEDLVPNPLLMQEDYFKQYQESIDNLKNNPELISFDIMCHELFEMNELGKKFIKYVEENFLLPSLARVGTPTYQLDVMWAEGFKDAFRKIVYAVKSHKQRIQAETNRNAR